MKRFIWISSLAGLVLLIGVTIWVVSWLSRPLDSPLELVVPPELAQVDQPAAAQSAPQLQKTCGGKGTLRMIVVGQASPITAGLYGADAIRLVVVDYDNETAAILGLPVDLWVDTPVLADLDVEENSLNMVYQLMYENASGNPDHVRTQKATQALAQTIVDVFEFVPDRYVTVVEEPFIEFIGELDGGVVVVNLPEGVDGTSEGYDDYPPGEQSLTGVQTLNLTRLLHPSGQIEPDILGRLERQNAVLLGMRDTMLLNSENLTKIPDLVKAVRKAITTDLSVDQALDLACMVEEVGNDADLLVVDDELWEIVDGHMVPDIEGIKELITQMGGGD